MNFGLKLNIKIFYITSIVFMPLAWIILAGVGDSALKFFHLPFLILIVSLIFKEYRQSLALFVSKQKIFITCFVLLMTVNFIATAFNNTVSSSAFTYIYKNFFYLILYFLSGSALFLFFGIKDHSKLMSIANMLAVILFLSITVLTFKGDFISDLIGFFFKGDLMGVKKDIYKSLFNSGNTAQDAELQISLLNQLTGAFIVIYFTSLYAIKNTDNIKYKIINIVSMTISVGLIIANLSRSNILAWIFGYVVYYACEIVVNKNYKKVLILFLGSVFFSFILIAFWSSISDKLSDTSAMFQNRFGSEIEDNARWAINQEAVNVFTQDCFNFFIGRGSAARVSDGHAVHNFILGSAYQAGILGLSLSIIIYLTLPFWVYKGSWILSNWKGAFALSALISVPLIRMMESGNAGTLTIQEWFCVALFLSCCYRKETELNENNLTGYFRLQHELN